MTTLDEYLTNLRASLQCPGARAFYFPPDPDLRRAQNLRLAREIGPALAAYPPSEAQKALGSLYGTLIVAHSLDSTGVQIDNKPFVEQVCESMEDWRGRQTTLEPPGLLAPPQT